MNITFNDFDCAVAYATAHSATISPVFQDENGFDFWIVTPPSNWVEDQSAFDFIENPLRDGTHLGRSLSSIWCIPTPEEGDRFKHQRCVPATAEEAAYYRSAISSVDEERNSSYQAMVQEHLDNGGSLDDF